MPLLALEGKDNKAIPLCKSESLGPVEPLFHYKHMASCCCAAGSKEALASK